MTAKKKVAGGEIRFGEAIEQLECILQRVESEEIDIDELAQELQKASELLELCRSKIRQAEVEVTQIVQSLEQDQADNEESGE